MGMIYHNGLPYGGGGSNISAAERELTYAEYLALTEEEKNNGTTYYITDVDNEGNITGYSAGAGINISEDKVISTTNEFEELSYADYQAGNYDKTKSYAIPDYPYINDSQKWKFVGSSTGENAISLPENFSELQIDMLVGSIHFVFHIIRDELTVESTQFRQGYYYSAQYYGYGGIYVSTLIAKVEQALQNGTNQTSNASIKVWYR